MLFKVVSAEKLKDAVEGSPELKLASTQRCLGFAAQFFRSQLSEVEEFLSVRHVQSIVQLQAHPAIVPALKAEGVELFP